MAIIMLEIKTENNVKKVEITCDLYRRKDRSLAHRVTTLFKIRHPGVFVFSDDTETGLEPDTEYIAVFSGINYYETCVAWAVFRTKPETITQFRILAFSCDRPDRMLLGQKNPWYDVCSKAYSADVMLHLGDQVRFTVSKTVYILIQDS